MYLHLHLQFTVFAFSTPISVRQMQFQFRFHFWSSFWSILGSISVSISAPKLVQKLFLFGSIFGTLSFEVLKLFKCLLGAFLNLSYSSWEPPRREKYGFPIVKSHFLKMMLFGTLRLLMSSLESSWRILAHSNPKTDPKTDPKMDPTWTQNWTKKCSIFGPILAHLLTSFWGHFGVKKSTDEIGRDSESVVLIWENYTFCKNDMIFM